MRKGDGVKAKSRWYRRWRKHAVHIQRHLSTAAVLRTVNRDRYIMLSASAKRRRALGPIFRQVGDSRYSRERSAIREARGVWRVKDVILTEAPGGGCPKIKQPLPEAA